MNSKTIKAPEELIFLGHSVFLAGSIEMGTAENWQVRIEKGLSNLGITILNPRRDDWDSTWEQSIDNPQFKQQVDWELNAMDRANIIAMYFDPSTKSPITLLELGLYAASDKLIVCCPNGYWRKGNVDIVCTRYNIQQVNSIEELLVEITIRYLNLR